MFVCVHAENQKDTFMMLGRVAYRGSLRRRSAVMTAGSGTFKVSVPLSVSRSTNQLWETNTRRGVKHGH